MGNPLALPLVIKIQYCVRGVLVSDHSPLVVWIVVKACDTLSPALFPLDNSITRHIEHFFLDNAHHKDVLIQWDAFTCYLRGIFISTITKIKTDTKAHEMQLTRMVRRLEEEYLASPSEQSKASWLSA